MEKFFAVFILVSGVSAAVSSKGVKEFQLYSCPFGKPEEIDDGKCSYNKNKLPEDETELLVPPIHAFVKVGDECFDWTQDDLVNTYKCDHPSFLSLQNTYKCDHPSFLSLQNTYKCDHPSFHCCRESRSLSDKGRTTCADEIPIFIRTWRIIGFKYLLWGFDSTRFAEIFVAFLRNCGTNSGPFQLNLN
ncbi:unnamed protein product [Mytilus coruscus]|uniref:Uncharacterized protein n=1 Tax=Mytilus coruscus TaxID=42192 RepID=A0A6J8AAU2_MYTCO|nr:unnamed protein product [Mytilus coruscus]